jgi:hypothetical protein
LLHADLANFEYAGRPHHHPFDSTFTNDTHRGSISDIPFLGPLSSALDPKAHTQATVTNAIPTSSPHSTGGIRSCSFSVCSDGGMWLPPQQSFCKSLLSMHIAFQRRFPALVQSDQQKLVGGMMATALRNNKCRRRPADICAVTSRPSTRSTSLIQSISCAPIETDCSSRRPPGNFYLMASSSEVSPATIASAAAPETMSKSSSAEPASPASSTSPTAYATSVTISINTEGAPES